MQKSIKLNKVETDKMGGEAVRQAGQKGLNFTHTLALELARCASM